MKLLSLSVQCWQLSFVSEPLDVPVVHTEDLDRPLRSPKQLQPDTIPWPTLHINIDTVSVVLVLDRKRAGHIWDCPNDIIIVLKALFNSQFLKSSIFPMLLYTGRREATVREKPPFFSSWHTGSAQKQCSQSELSVADSLQIALYIMISVYI